MLIDIEKYDQQSSTGSVEAIFDARIQTADVTLTLHRLKLIRGRQGGFFLSLPQYCKDGFDGKKVFFPYISFEGEFGRQMTAQIMEILKANFLNKTS